ncbi:MAG TPA: ParA family protein [Anaerolineae bacterium]|nr:ParA family protein [Anaerolineae bacterium]
MAQIIAVANQKGGTGKTTTTLNLGAALQEMGNSVLLVDMDPQASLTLALGLNPDDLETTIYTALTRVIETGEMDPAEIDIVTTDEGMGLLPTNIELSQADLDLVREPLGVYALRDVLRPTIDTYDYILVDCPPSLGILTTNGLAAAGQVIIPLQADYLALKGVNLLLRTITKIQRRANRRLQIAGVLLTMADLRTLHAREMIATTRQAFNERVFVFETVIRMSVQLKEAPITGRSVLTYASDTGGADAYRELARELVSRPSTPVNSTTEQLPDDEIEEAGKEIPEDG